MKKIKYIFPLIALLFLVACDSNDDGFYNTKYVQAENLVGIVNPATTYAVGDVIGVRAFVPKYLPEPGQVQPLNVLETTGNAPSFDFSYILEKKNADGDWEIYDVSTHYVEGAPNDANVGYFVQGFLRYNTGADQYEYEGGIQLTEAGDYRLNLSNNTDNYNKVAMRSNSINNNIVLKIFSTSEDLDASGYFVFTVN